jgi:uncharacterized damage-inducible protein DinB
MSSAHVDPSAAYLADILKTFRNYKALAERAIAKAPDDALHTELDANSNSIAVTVKHVAGNLRSRFRDFLTSDGEKPDRNRDTEFEMPERVSRAEMMRRWDESWAIVLGSIEALTPQDLTRTVHIRGEAFLVVEALNRSVTHTAYHVGQMVYLARHFAGASWSSLSIPKGASAKAGGDFKSKGIAR